MRCGRIKTPVHLETSTLKNMTSKLASRIKRWRKPLYWYERSLEAYRVTTSPLRLLPEFLIIGVQKGGTSSLYKYLEEHPCVAPALVKEVHFFDNKTRDHKYGKGMPWYRSHFAYSAHRTYHNLVHHQQLITGEASPDYIFDPFAPKRVASLLPQAKLILMLRNPVDRTYSHYLHNVRAFWDPKREPLSFEEAIAIEETRLKGEIEKLQQDDSYFSYNYMHYTYLRRGIYADQLERWFEFFPREQILILKSEDFFADPGLIFKQVLEFLDLPTFELSEYISFNARTQNSLDIPPEIKAWLVDYFRPHNQRLYQLLGTNFDWDG